MLQRCLAIAMVIPWARSADSDAGAILSDLIQKSLDKALQFIDKAVLQDTSRAADLVRLPKTVLGDGDPKKDIVRFLASRAVLWEPEWTTEIAMAPLYDDSAASECLRRCGSARRCCAVGAHD